MSTAPKAIDDEQRLAEIRSLPVLSTRREERFDRVTRLAQRLFDVPAALVSVVGEERQWFKSAQGFDGCETSRDDSFCAHAILRDDVMVVADATADARFADNPFVARDPGIRFYAGCPIHGPSGARLGTLCIHDYVARDFDEDDAATLRDLALIVEGEIASEHLAITDPLTGLSNRRGFALHADRLIKVCERQELPLAVVLLDLDHFRIFNDRFGYAAGDQLLREFAVVLEHEVRESDAIGRLGADKFAILLTNATASSNIGERIRGSFARSSTARDYAVNVTYGLAMKRPDEKCTIDDLLRSADAAMYEQKAQESARLA